MVHPNDPEENRSNPLSWDDVDDDPYDDEYDDPDKD
jgi:hypothetical protein